MNSRRAWPLALAVGILIVAAVAFDGSHQAAQSESLKEAATTINSGLQVDCGTADGLAAVSFGLDAAPGASQRRIDITVVDNGFLPGTFLGSGPLPADATSITWPGIKPNQPLYWRVNTLSDAGWSAGQTRLFVPCAATDLDSASSCDTAAGTVVFKWAESPLAVQQQWLDVSAFDNGFVPGTFRSVGPLPADATSIKWDGLPGSAVVWRLNTLTSDGWLTSETRAISTCDEPEVLHPRFTCVGDTVVVEFRWAPSSPPGVAQFLDLSLQLNGFADGTYLTSGPLPPNAQSLVWQGLQPNQPHYFRLNTLTATGWQSSVTRSFVPTC